MPYRQYNKIPVPVKKAEEKKPLSRIQSELAFVNNGNARKTAGQRTNTSPSPSRSATAVAERENVKSHPKYGKPYESDEMKRKHRQAQARRAHEQQLMEKRQRASKARQKELLRQKKLREETRRERRLEEKRRKEYEKKRRDAVKKRNARYGKEKSAEENARARMQKERSRIRFQKRIRSYLARTVAFFICGIILFFISFAVNMFSLNRYAAVNTGIYVRIGENDKYRAERTSAFVCVQQLAQLCELTSLDANNTYKYISPGSGNEYIELTADSCIASVNGNSVSLTAAPYVEDERLYAPLSFFEEYCYGLDISYDEDKNLIQVERVMTNENDVKNSALEPIYEDMAFTLKSIDIISHIDELTAPER